MISEFNKFVGNKILGWFLTHPTTSMNINELARELKVSAGSVKRFTDLFAREKLVDMKKVGTAHMFRLNNSSVAARELKRAGSCVHFTEATISWKRPVSKLTGESPVSQNPIEPRGRYFLPKQNEKL